jgi:hypothetical protein
VRALKVSVALLLLVLLVGDRIGAVVAANVIATRLQTAGSLSSKPDVSIRGWPFLTQAVSGRYDRIELTVDHVERRTIALERFEVTVKGAQVALGDALGGRVDAVPVEGLTARALIRFASIADRIGAGATAERSGRDVLVTGRGPFRIIAHPTVDGTTLRIGRLQVAIGTLPYGVRITGASVADDGVLLTATSGPTVLQRP